MLPDYPSLKLRLGHKFERRFHERVGNAAPVASRIGRRIQHEGDSAEYERLDGGGIVREGFERIEFRISIPAGLDTEATFKAAKEQVDAAVQSLAEQEERLFFKKLEEITEGHGVDAGGKPLTPELLLAMFERMDFQFDVFGRWIIPKSVVHPTLAPAAQQIWEDLLRKQPWKAQLGDLIVRKRRAWLVREGSRKLVG